MFVCFLCMCVYYFIYNLFNLYIFFNGSPFPPLEKNLPSKFVNKCFFYHNYEPLFNNSDILLYILIHTYEIVCHNY